MEISDFFKTVIINTLKQSWYIWVVLGLLIILPIIIKTFRPTTKEKNSKKISGIAGEEEVTSILNILNHETYKVINGIKIHSGTLSAQIDHLIISNFGIFVIETKNFNGIIIGEETSNYWTQILYKNRTNFLNPIKQNYFHVQVLKDKLKEYPNIFYFPIVVFTSISDLRVKTITDVIKTDDLLGTIRHHMKEIISDKVRDNIYNYFTDIKSNKVLEIRNNFQIS